MSLLKLNLARHKAAQDMIKLIEKEKGLSTSAAIDFAVNPRIFRQIINTGVGPIALPIWGHGEPQRKWLTLDDPHINIDFDENKLQLICDVAAAEKTNTETAVAYFLLFTMEALGYHI